MKQKDAQDLEEAKRLVAGSEGAPEGSAEFGTRTIESSAIASSAVRLTPAVYFFYDYARGHGFPGSMTEFLHQAVLAYFRQNRLKLAVIREEE